MYIVHVVPRNQVFQQQHLIAPPHREMYCDCQWNGLITVDATRDISRYISICDTFFYIYTTANRA